MIKIIKETEIVSPLYIGKLENGIHIYVFEGYAEDKDGNIYKSVFARDEDDLVMLGWTLENKDNPIDGDSIILEDYILSEDEKPKEKPKPKMKKVEVVDKKEEPNEKKKDNRIQTKAIWRNGKLFFEDFEEVEE